ncbi:MAG: hypothetical protein PHT94_02955 [Candidatus Nanoarchaeia archaeon]|nr:hypothetical protein [Candidatus Nanoarchaeia archaeon]
MNECDYEKIYEANDTKLFEDLTKEEIELFKEKRKILTQSDYVDPKYYFPRKSLITIDGADKTGKGTMTNHLAYALSELGYNVLVTPFPNYSGFGFYVEMMSSFSKIKEIISQNRSEFRNVDIDDWEKNIQKYWGLYALDRIGSASQIENALIDNKIVLTKRGSKFTHSAYQIAFNGVEDEEMVKNLDSAFPNPMLIINLHSQEQLRKTFLDKGSSVADYYESLPEKQKKVIEIQSEFTINPQKVCAKYGFFQRFQTPDVRLKESLERILILFEKNNIKRSNHPGTIEVFGQEEPSFDLRSKDGLIEFFNSVDQFFFMNLLFKDQKRIIESDDKDKYKKLFTIGENIDNYAISQKESIDNVIANFK